MTDEEIKSLDDKLDKLVKAVTEIHVALAGYNGNKGLIGEFSQHCIDNNEFKEEFYKFRRTLFLILGFMVGSGMLGVGIYEFITNLI